MVAMGFVPNVWFAIPPMLVIGAAWLIVVNTLMVATQMMLPNWIRARGMSIFQVVMMGSSAAAAALWGQVASASDLRWSLAGAAIAGVAALFALRKLPCEFDDAIDLTPSKVLTEPEPAIQIEYDQGPVMVQIEFEIDPARAAEFAAVMREARINRLQSGALSWGLFQDVARPGRYIEYFLDESWAQFRRRFERMTAHDIALRERRNAFDLRPEGPKITRYVAESIKR
jgi:MFS family permease